MGAENASVSGTADDWPVGPGGSVTAGPDGAVDASDDEALEAPPPVPVAHPASIDTAMAITRKRNRVRGIRDLRLDIRVTG
jgi:hypothetical protein